MSRLIIGVNDLATRHPELVEEWDFIKNDPLLPERITCGSNKKVWWRCKNEHVWQATVSERTRKDKPSGCPYCAHKKVLYGVNDLATRHPELVEEWDYQKNNPLKPEQFLSGSNKIVWWKCKRCGYEWQAAISSRTMGRGCPSCHKGIHTSFQEQAILYYVKQAFPKTINGYKPGWDKSKSEFDIYIPDLKLGIEYDGQKWHQDVNKDIKKTEWAYRNGAQLIRIREPECPILKDSSYQIVINEYDSNYYYLEKAIRGIFAYISECFGTFDTIKCDINADYQKILATYENNKFNESLISAFPGIAEEWDYDKNAPLTPSNVTAHTYKKVWWKCRRCGNSYVQSVSNRTSGNGCPYCVGKKVKKGFNDLLTLNPTLAGEWHPSLNQELTPCDITVSSRKSVWWKCKACGFEWKAAVYSRSTGIGCPACANKAVWAGHNDLLTTNPELSEEWDYEKNTTLMPRDVTKGSHRAVWWRCKECGFSWKTPIVNRSKGSGCPQCAKKAQSISSQKQNLIPGKSDLKTTNPELVEEWDYERNGLLLPEDVTAGSGKSVWWKCKKCGHKWKAVIQSRTNGTGCPECRRTKMSLMMKTKALRNGDNDLASTSPLLLEEWDYERNFPNTPKDVTAGSSKKAWWKCKKCGYKWEARINHRVNGVGCPVCANKTVWPGHNDLATLRPELVLEWDYEHNNPLTPKDVTAGSGKKVWWKCKICGFEWFAPIKNRSIGYGKCPNCSKTLGKRDQKKQERCGKHT